MNANTLNFDPKANIHYGVISCHSINPDVLSDIDLNSRDLSHEHAVEEIKKSLRLALEDHFSTMKWNDKPSRLDRVVELAWDAIEDLFNDNYQNDDRDWLYEQDGYKLTNCLINDIFVIKSPYYTFAKRTSPCVPGAADLDNPYENGLKVYCLGPEFFEDNKSPYPVYSVETGEIVSKPE